MRFSGHISFLLSFGTLIPANPFYLSPFTVYFYSQTDRKDYHIQLKSGDVYAIEIQELGCFAAERTSKVIYGNM